MPPTASSITTVTVTTDQDGILRPILRRLRAMSETLNEIQAAQAEQKTLLSTLVAANATLVGAIDTYQEANAAADAALLAAIADLQAGGVDAAALVAIRDDMVAANAQVAAVVAGLQAAAVDVAETPIPDVPAPPAP